jgi:hypothetical protein
MKSGKKFTTKSFNALKYTFERKLDGSWIYNIKAKAILDDKTKKEVIFHTKVTQSLDLKTITCTDYQGDK